MIGRDWTVGMEVVCVESTENRDGYGDEILPVKGEHYTLRDIGVDPAIGSVCVWLVEIVNEERRYTHSLLGRDVVTEPAFPAYRFRPVQRRKTDISVFQALLNPSEPEAERPVAPAREPA